MYVLIDTCVWSMVLRKNKKDNQSEKTYKLVEELINEFRVQMIGPIRQEVLSGISNKKQYYELRELLSGFEDITLTTPDYERAADMYNICRTNGIQGNHIDFIICAVAERYHLNIFTFDKDFQHYAKHLPIRLFQTQVK